jgi:putative nucleotidyltransferase with HDIG domain
VIAATALVALLPTALAWTLRAAGSLSEGPGIAVAALLSVGLFYLGDLYWQRRRSSSDLLFGELMIWGWVRRRLVERRLNQTITALGLEPQKARRTPFDLSPEHRMELFLRLAADLKASDPYTHGHSGRVARYAMLMASHMRLSRHELARIRAAALLHDVGKLYTPHEILHKPGRLTEEEFDVVKRHTVHGARMIMLLLGDQELASIVLHHHERFDGTGYPCWLSRDMIPLGARIIAVADTFDAITSKRPYRPAMPHKVALDVLRREAGVQLDPAAVQAFLAVYDGRRSLGALAAFSGAAESALPTLTRSAPAVAGIAASVAAVGGGGLALSPRQHRSGPMPARLTARPYPSLAAARLTLFSGTVASPRRQPAPDGPGKPPPQPVARIGARPLGGNRPDPFPKPGASRPGAGSGGGTTGPGSQATGSSQPSSSGSSQPSSSASSTAPPVGAGNGITATTGRSGIGATVSKAGATATATAASSLGTSTTNPGAGVAVGAGKGGANAGANVSASGDGGVTTGVSVTPAAVP